MQYRYVAVDEHGQVHRGQIEAADAAAARAWAAARYLVVLAVRPARAWWATPLRLTLGPPRVPPVPLAFYFRQVAAMLRVGVPIGRALALQAASTRHRTLRGIAQALADAVARGSRVSEALRAWPTVFPPLVVRLLRGAEETGHLEQGFQDAGDYLMAGYQIRKKILGALYYPVTAMALLIGAGIFLVYKVFPVLATMYQAFDVKLPGLTVALIAFTHWALAVGPRLGAGAAAGVGGLVGAVRTRRGRLARDRAILRIPLVGVIVQLGIWARFLRTLRSALGAALPLDEALDLAAAATANTHVQQAIRGVTPRIIAGQGLAGPLRDTHLFAPLIVQGLEVGEDTGTLDRSLESLVAYYDQELDQRVKGLAEAIQPILTGIAAVGVGFLLAATLLPLYYIMGHIHTA